MKRRIFAYGTSLLLAALGSGPAGTKAQPAPAAKPLAANVLMLLTPKENVAYLQGDNTLRQGLERMRAHGYTAVPVLEEDGSYLGSVSEGDFLWCLLDQGSGDIQTQEKQPLRRVIRPGFNPAVRIDVALEELVERALRQSFIPVVDDRGAFVGIVTRQTIIRRLTTPRLEDSLGTEARPPAAAAAER